MKSLRKFPSWLPRKLESIVFSVFALLWTASFSGCQTTEPSDKVIAKYGGPPVEDSVHAKYGIQQPTDTLIAKYGAPPPKDSVVALYGIKQPDPIQVRYGVLAPVDTVIAKYGVPRKIDSSKTNYTPTESDTIRSGEASEGEA